MKMDSFLQNTLALTLLSCSVNAFADEAPAPTRETSFNLSIGLTTGGDTLADLEFEDGDSESVKAGGLAYFGAGVNIPVKESFSVQLNAAYHFDTASASNADLTFSRLSLEAITFYHFNDKVRLGLGVFQPVSASLELDGDLGEDSVDFDADLGVLIELGVRSFGNSWWGLRYADVNYQLEDSFIEIDTDGSYIGAFFTYGF